MIGDKGEMRASRKRKGSDDPGSAIRHMRRNKRKSKRRSRR